MKFIVPALLFIVACSLAIDVDHDETTLGRGLFEYVKKDDVSTLTAESLKEQTKTFLDQHEDIVKRLLTNALNKEIMEPNNWNTWQEMVKAEAADVSIKEGELEAFTAHLKKSGEDKTAPEITLETIIEYFNPIAEKLASEVGIKHSLPQQTK